ncbi:MAG: hypothetical protein R3286_07275 [Gammaproteobacteria bacterium]|nr:hypothetical protein [Gammaproteobacteria bacterium]
MPIRERLCEKFVAEHPAEAVRALEMLDEKELGRYLSRFTPEVAARALERMTPPHAAACLNHMTPGVGAVIAAEIALELRVAALRLMPERRRAALLERLTGIVAEQTMRLLNLSKGTVGDLMEPAGLILSDDLTAQDARSRVRRSKEELYDPIFVVDRAQRLVGMLGMHALLKARRDDQIATLMHRDVPLLNAADSRELIFTSPLWYEFDVLAVVDTDNVLLGVLPHHVLHRARREAREEQPGGGALDTMLALGELYWLGLSGVMSGMSGVGTPRTTPAEPPGREGET